MSYQVIARKWRPQVFEEVIGQESVTRTLRNAIAHDRLHHAYIFSGARGVGKTTTARLLAKALNCHKTDTPNPEPCDTSSDKACPSCVEVSESRSLDVIEFDAASNTQVEKIRDLILENIQVSAARDRFKIFIIDEVHMLSRSSFNALLKTLEEPPEKVVFVMATTELHKVPDTILSRVQEFEFRTIPQQKILDRLKTISEAEKIDISDEALKEIARSGEGSMRDAQSNFDQIISFSGDKIEVNDVVDALGIASAENLTAVMQAIADEDSKVLLEVVSDLISRGQDLRNFCKDLLSFLRDLLVFKMAGDAENLLDTAILSFEDLRRYSEPFSEADMIRFFNSLAETETNLREANEPRYLLEIGLIKLTEMKRLKPLEDILQRITELESTLTNNIVTVENTENSNTREPSEEKKTLNPPETKHETKKAVPNSTSTPDISESPEQIDANEEPQSDFQVTQENEHREPPTSININKMPVKLEPIDPAELEHVADKYLDSVYEYKLLHEGDNLAPVKNAKKIVAELLGRGSEAISVAASTTSASNGTAVRTKTAEPNKALDIVSEMTQLEDIDETIPTLPQNPVEEDLQKFAANHPTVKKVIRIFRGKLVKVEQENSEN